MRLLPRSRGRGGFAERRHPRHFFSFGPTPCPWSGQERSRLLPGANRGVNARGRIEGGFGVGG